MADDPIELDEYRGMSAQKATEIRRQLQEVAADQAALRQRRDDLEALLAAGPAENWADLVVKLRYLIEILAGTSEAQEARRQMLIANVLDDLDRLGPPAD
jgi:hypothetical protein